MPKQKRNTSGSTFTVVERLDDTGTVTVEETTVGQTYEIDMFADERVRERVKALPEGSTVELLLTPTAAGERIAGVASGMPMEPFGAD